MKKKELILNKPSENKFYYQCVYNKIKKRQCYSLSTPEQKKPLYRSYSPRLQFLFDEKIDEITKLYKEAWVSVEFLTYGNVKIEKVQYSNIDNEFTLEIIIGENISRKLKTMSHFVCDIKVSFACLSLQFLKSTNTVSVFFSNIG